MNATPPKELWKQVDGFAGYEVSSLGRVRSVCRSTAQIGRGGKLFVANRVGRILLPSIGSSGYARVTLSIKNSQTTMSVHRMVCAAFVSNPMSLPQVNHKNGDKLDNRSENVEWATQSLNMRHAYSTGLQSAIRGELHYACKLSDSDVATIRKLVASGESQSSVARKFCISQGYLSTLVRRIRRQP